MPNEQLPLFPRPGAKPTADDRLRVDESAPLTVDSSLSAAIAAYHTHMKQQGLSPYTIQAFGGDLNILRKYIGSNIALGQISTQQLERFLNWLRYDRGIPCKPKSFQRRLTTLKVFFGWLTQSNVIPEDPAAQIAHLPVTSPLPEILYPDQVEKLVAAARQLLENEKSDARPYLLVMLLLTTGLKKSEVMAMRTADIDLSSRTNGVLYIRYDDARKRHKERKLRLADDFADVYQRYLAQYHPNERVFECTARNLEYILADLAKVTGLGETVSFESLRWTCAVQDYQSGKSEDHIRQKLGLSTITWDDAGPRLRKLAGKAL